MTQTQEIPAETGNMKRDFARWIKDTPGQVSLYQAYHAGRIHGDAAYLRATAPAGGWRVPDGWKLVPVEPDDAMIEAGQDACEEKKSWGGRVYASDVWEAMLAAASNKEGA